MVHQALARKHRPQTFDEVVGQTHVLRPLINALKQNRLHHAYLFTGTRGVGKTTLGRILAKCLNCEQGITPTPCNTCSHCLEITQGQYPDLIEVDAASRTKVEDTRDLLDNIAYAPSKGRFKVYLIDEVHMLSKHSFNALLKTLEEPPAHVKFLLATTDPEKLPPTIISRCLQFHLKHLTQNQIESHLEKTLTAEAIPFEKKTLSPIAKAAKGSVRDALTLLDQAIAYGDQNLSVDDVTTLLGTIEDTVLIDIFTALKDSNAHALFKTTEQLFEKAVDINQLMDAIATQAHQMAISKALNQANELASHFSAEDLQHYYKISTTSLPDIHLSPTPKMGLDMMLLRMLAVKHLKQTAKTPQPAQPTSPKPAPQPIAQAPAKPAPQPALKTKNPMPAQKKTAGTHKNEQINAIMKAFNAKLTNDVPDY